MNASKTTHTSGRAVLIFALIAAGYFYCSMQRVSAGVVLPHMGTAYGFSAAMVGFLSSLFFYSYGYVQNLWGSLSDRFGPLRSCSAGLAIAGLGSLLFTLSPSPLCIGISRIVIGFGLASIFTGIFLYAALAFPAGQYPFWAGAILVSGNLGTVAAVAPLGWIMDRLGYNGLYLLLAAMAFTLSALLYALRGDTGAHTTHAAAETTGSASLGHRAERMLRDVLRGFSLVLGDRPVWVIVFVWAALSAAVMTLQGLWGVSWLSASSGADTGTARFWVTFVSIGLVVGSPLGSKITFLSRGSRNGILWIMIGIVGTWAIYMYGAFRGFSGGAMGAVGLAVGIASGAGMVYCSSSLKSLVPLSYTGVVFGTAQIVIYTMVILCQWGTGLVINRFPGETTGHYLNKGYVIGFGAVVGLLAVALLSILSVRSFRKEESI